MSKFTDYKNQLTAKFNKASATEKVAIGGAALAGAALFHPAIIAGGLVTAAVAAGAAAVGTTEGFAFINKKNKGPKQ